MSRAVSDLEEAEQADPFSGAVQSGVGNLDPFGAAGQDAPSSSGKGVSDLEEADRLREQEGEVLRRASHPPAGQDQVFTSYYFRLVDSLTTQLEAQGPVTRVKKKKMSPGPARRGGVTIGVEGIRFRASGLGFRVKGLGLRV